MARAGARSGSTLAVKSKTEARSAAKVARRIHKPDIRDFFRHFADGTARGVGSPWTFALAVAVVVLWAVLGPHFRYSDTWQLVINTGTTIVTFLVVFLIQNTQNRDAAAFHLKLDELIRGVAGARTGLVNLECLSEEEIEALRKEFARIHEREATKDRRSRA